MTLTQEEIDNCLGINVRAKVSFTQKVNEEIKKILDGFNNSQIANVEDVEKFCDSLRNAQLKYGSNVLFDRIQTIKFGNNIDDYERLSYWDLEGTEDYILKIDSVMREKIDVNGPVGELYFSDDADGDKEDGYIIIAPRVFVFFNNISKSIAGEKGIKELGNWMSAKMRLLTISCYLKEKYENGNTLILKNL
ncbi:hypothetical protein KAZ01_03360 [Candidatus Gracilibacteria bacterium]|nr:hypothetical protein [Candidatus Gracilibacteria bacterium]